MNSYSTSWWSLLLIYRRREDEKLSWLCWLTYSRRFTHINGYPSAASPVQSSESSPVRDRRSTTEPPNQQLVSDKLKNKHHRNTKIGRLLSLRAVMRSSFKVKGQCHQVDECWDRSASYLPSDKTYELQTWYMGGVRRPLSQRSVIVTKVKGQGCDVTWCVWQVLAHKSRTKVPETPKLIGRLAMSGAIMCTSFKVKVAKVKVSNAETESVSCLPSLNIGTPMEHAILVRWTFCHVCIKQSILLTTVQKL